MARPLPFLSRSHLLLVLVAILTVASGIGFRLWRLTADPLWLDEAYSAYAASKGFDFLWAVVPQYETHPPFYYSMLRVWTLVFGDSLAGLRSLGAFCGIIVIGAGAWAAHEIGRAVALERRNTVAFVSVAAMLISLGTLPIEMAREVRPYPVMILVYVTAIGTLFRVSRHVTGHVTERRRLLSAAYGAYLALLALMLWLHNLGVLYGGSLGIAFLILCWRRSWTREDWAAFLVGHALVLAAWSPALMILAEQAPTWVQSTWLRFSPSWKLVWIVAKIYIPPHPEALAAALLLILVAAIRLGRRAEGARTTAALMILTALPVAASLLISWLVAPIFILRTMAAVAAPAMLLVALGVATSRSVATWLIGLLALSVMLVEMVALDAFQRTLKPQEDWYRVIAWLEPRFAAGDVVLAYPNEGALPFRFALRDKAVTMPTRPIPTDMPTLDGGPGAWNPTGSRGVFSLPKVRLEAIAAEPETRRIPTVWLLRQGPWAYDKGDHLLHALERDRVQVGHFFTFPIDVIGLRRKDLPPVAAAEQAKP